MTLRLVDATRDTGEQSRLKYYADALERARKDLDAAWAQLPTEVGAALRPSVLEVQQRLGACVELALIAGYRAGLVDFYEDTPPPTTY